MNQSTHYDKVEILTIILPPLLTVVLFAISVFAIILPSFQAHLLKQKKMLLASGTHIAWNVMHHYDREYNSGKISLELAQKSAIDQIRNLRYGPDDKNYFWLNDLQPKMIMHPYRTELEGKNLTNYSDPEGKFLFKESVDIALNTESGYLEYVWQWKDDTNNLVPKVSHVRLFTPWGWIIGTGVYIEDIRRETARVRKIIIVVSLGILAVVLCLSLIIIRNTHKEMAKRQTAEKELNSYKDHLEELVEIRTTELQKAHKEVKILCGYLPICSSCKKIRDSKGSWKHLETYIKNHSEADFTHGICPECAQKLYPELNLPDKLNLK